MPPVQFDGSHYVLHRRTMDAPSAQPADLQRGLLGRQDQLSGGGNVELLQHLQADTSRAIQPETGDQLDCDPALITRSGVESVNEDIGVDKLARQPVNAHAANPGSRRSCPQSREGSLAPSPPASHRGLRCSPLPDPPIQRALPRAKPEIDVSRFAATSFTRRRRSSGSASVTLRLATRTE